MNLGFWLGLVIAHLGFELELGGLGFGFVRKLKKADVFGSDPVDDGGVGFRV